MVGTFAQSPFVTNPIQLSNIGLYQTIGFDFYSLPRQTIVKLGIVLAQDNSTIEECQRPLTDELRRREEPPASIELPITQNECAFEVDGDRIPGQCYCSDVSWGGPTCESPAVVTLMKGKQVCAGWSRPGYNVFSPLDGMTVLPVDSDGVWSQGASTGCVCLNPGMIIRTRMNPITRFANPSIYLSEKLVTDNDYTDYTPS